MIDDQINATEVIRGFNHIVHIQHLVFYTDGVGFKNITCLVVRQAAALDVVRVVGQVDLGFVIDASGILRSFFFLQNGKQCFDRRFFAVTASRLFHILRNVPCFADQHSTRNTFLCTVISHASFGNIPLFRYFCNRKIVHMLTSERDSCIYSIPYYRQEIYRRTE